MTRVSLEYQGLVLLERKREFPKLWISLRILSTFRNNFDMSKTYCRETVSGNRSYKYTYSPRYEVTHVDASSRKRSCGKRKSDPEIAERISSRLVIYGCGLRCVRTAATAWEILLAAKFVNLPHDVVRAPNIASYYRNSLFTIETLFRNVLLFFKESEALRFFLNLLLQHTIALCIRLHWKIDGKHEIVRSFSFVMCEKNSINIEMFPAYYTQYITWVIKNI